MAWESYDTILSSGLHAGAWKREVSDEIGLLALDERYTLTNRLNARAGDIANTLTEWFDDTLRARTVTFSSNTTTTQTSGDTALKIVEDATTFVIAGDQIRVRGTGELLLCTGTTALTGSTSAGSTITVTRGYGGTTATKITDGVIGDVLHNSKLEAAAFSANIEPGHARRLNYTQIFRRDFELSRTAQNNALVSGETPLADLLNKASKELLADFGRFPYNGASPASTQQGSASVRRTADSMAEMAREGSASSLGAIYSDATTTDYDTSTTAFDNLHGHIRQVAATGANPNTVAVGFLQKQRLAVDSVAGHYTVPGVNEVNRNKSAMQTAFGFGVEIMLDAGVPQDQAFIFNDQDGQFLYQTRPTLRRVPVADSDQFTLVWEVTLKWKNAHRGSVGVFYDLA